MSGLLVLLLALESMSLSTAAGLRLLLSRQWQTDTSPKPEPAPTHPHFALASCSAPASRCFPIGRSRHLFTKSPEEDAPTPSKTPISSLPSPLRIFPRSFVRVASADTCLPPTKPSRSRWRISSMMVRTKKERRAQNRPTKMDSILTNPPTPNNALQVTAGLAVSFGASAPGLPGSVTPPAPPPSPAGAAPSPCPAVLSMRAPGPPHLSLLSLGDSEPFDKPRPLPFLLSFR